MANVGLQHHPNCCFVSIPPRIEFRGDLQLSDNVTRILYIDYGRFRADKHCVLLTAVDGDEFVPHCRLFT